MLFNYQSVKVTKNVIDFLFRKLKLLFRFRCGIKIFLIALVNYIKKSFNSKFVRFESQRALRFFYFSTSKFQSCKVFKKTSQF